MKRIQCNRAHILAKKFLKVCYDHWTPKRIARGLQEIGSLFWCLERSLDRYNGWDQGGPQYITDLCKEHFDADHYHIIRYRKGYDRRNVWEEPRANRFLAALETCIRAAIDLTCPAQEGMPGVLGFTVGEIKRLHKRPAPLWFKKQVLEATMVSWDDEKTETAFKDLPDDRPLLI